MTVESVGSTREPWPGSFAGSLWSLVAFVAVVTAIVTGANVLQAALVGANPPLLVGLAVNVPFFLLLGAVGVLALRYEGVSIGRAGYAPRLLAPAIVAALAVVVALNVLTATIALLTEGGVVTGGLLETTPTVAAATVAVNYLLVGPVEELILRGYLQNKLVDVLGGRDERWRVALAIVGMGVVFGLMHLPGLVIQGGADLVATLPVVAWLAGSGILFGVIYELTRNLYLVALLHGFGNAWPLFVGRIGVLHWALVVVVYTALILAYRWWARKSTRRLPGLPA